MDFMKTARALDDTSFKWRVKAAGLNYAADNVTSLPAGNEKNMALYLLLHPDRVDPSMVAFAAVDDVVAAAITVTDNAVDTSKVPDEEILRVVSASWGKISVKYDRNPLQSPTTGGAV